MNKDLTSSLMPNSHQAFRIGDWLVEPDTCRVTMGDNAIKLEPKVMGLLVYLAQRPGRVVSREELERALWAGTVVGYDALTSAVIKLRKAFGDDPHRPWLVETVAKKGYRLVAPIAGDAHSLPTYAMPRRRLALRYPALAMALGIALGWLIFKIAATDDIPAIAVLPFADLSNDPKLAYFGEGVREDIVTDLSKLSGVRVIAHSPQPPTSPSDTWAARFILKGSVRRIGDDIRVTAKLIDTETGTHVWAEGYNRRLHDIFAVQEEVTRNIVAALALSLSSEENEYLARRDTRSVEAYDLFLKGQARYARHSADDNAAARDYFLRALALDGNFTRAHGALALAYTDDFRFGWTNDTAIAANAALFHAERALALDTRSAQAHWVLGFVQLHVRKDHAAAVRLGERAIRLDSRNASAHGLLAAAHVYGGDTYAAVRHSERALQLDPERGARYRTILGIALYFSGRYDQARAALEQTLEHNPARLLPQIYLAATLSRLGQSDEARWIADTIRITHSEHELHRWASAQPFATRTQLHEVEDDLNRTGFY